MRLIFIFLLFSCSSKSRIDKHILPVFDATYYTEVDLSIKKKTEIGRQAQLLELEILTKSEKEELDSLLVKYGEVVESVWDVIDGGCSWYCGGGNYKVKASSFLKTKTGNVYTSKSANDIKYNTAWIEGKEDAGIGEYIEYYFKNKSPRVTSIIISNGYMKSDERWMNHNRVKSFKIYINGKPYCILNLMDKKGDQFFKIGTLGHNKDGTDLIIRFEIIEVYRGEKFNRTAITEIYFDGIDVH